MLKKLTIEQFVLIDRLELDFQSGLTILTGETGAGKSILLGAMGLILGEPSNTEAIRQGSDHSVIEAHFVPSSTHPTWNFFAERGLQFSVQEGFRIRRIIRLGGGDEIFLNNQSINREVLEKIGTLLAEIHGQFANQTLLDPSNQMTLLDLSGDFPPEVFKNVIDSLHDVHRYTRELEEENLFLNSNKRDRPKIEEIVGRFEALGMHKDFIPETEAEYARLLTAKETSEAFQAILAQLIAANGVVMSLSSVNNILANNPNLDAEKMANLRQYLSDALENARAALKEMREIGPDYDIDTRPLEQYKEILNTLRAIGKDTKTKYEDLTTYFEEISAKLTRMRNGPEKIAKLDSLLAKAKRSYMDHAHILSEKRMVAGKALSEAITAELAPLKLMSAEFQVLVEEKLNIPWTERGLNEVTFTARMNPGMPFSPVSETASGGELARLILALKVVLQKVQSTTTLVFDEVDTGIGGAAAAAVGERLALLAEDTQVLVITHSPQVASRGDQHLHVSKKTDGLTTTSVVKTLSLEERIDEISRMLAGDVLTAESRAAAKSLIDEASRAAGNRQKSPSQN